MEKFDLEDFPTSNSAKKMLSYVSDGFYDESYVGKWIFQVMGIEYDAALSMVENLSAQFYPETATWGLMYHEIKWQLPVRDDLSYEERRRIIYLKRDYRAPMTPYNMERYLNDVTNTEVHIADINDPGECGFVATHPNVFKAFFILGEETQNLKFVYKILNRLKQSHTTYEVMFDYKTSINIRSVAVGSIGNTLKVKARVAQSIKTVSEDKSLAALLFENSVSVKASNEIKESDVYVMSESGEKIRVLTENGSMVRTEAGWK